MACRPSKPGRLYLLVLLVLAACAACGDDLPAAADGGGAAADAAVPDAAAADAAAAPPAGLRITGSAAGEAGADRVECWLAIDLVNLVGEAGDYSGVAVGEVFRRTYDGEDPRFEFQALVGGPASLSIADGAVELRLVGDQPADAVPFWLTLEVVAGAQTAPFTYQGEWTCAPVLVGDPMDSPIEAAGTWTADALGSQ
jgi:hypothetical protein